MATNDVSMEDLMALKEKCLPLFEEDPSKAHNDASLRRFLKAFQDVETAHTAILKCSKWREEYGVESITEDDTDIQKEAATGKAVLSPHKDISGRPLIYIAARKHNAYERDIDRLTRYIVFMLESACKQCNEEVIDNLCIVFDLKDFAIANMDYQFIKNLIWLLSKYYPERLGICLIINAPMIFYGCWTGIRPWLNEVTASKVTFISNDKQLSEYIPPDLLPKD